MSFVRVGEYVLNTDHIVSISPPKVEPDTREQGTLGELIQERFARQLQGAPPSDEALLAGHPLTGTFEVRTADGAEYQHVVRMVPMRERLRAVLAMHEGSGLSVYQRLQQALMQVTEEARREVMKMGGGPR